jgi:tRNA threonylcarbamoyladenosine biosynthesis protein TsaE
MTHILSTVDDTRAYGRRLAAVLRAGDLVVLSGTLGAGKTTLAQGIGAGLGVAGPVTSPTFVIARVHRPDPARGGRLPLVHVDAYRIGAAADPLAEIDDLDLDASLPDSVTLVEWGEGLVERLAGDHLEVRLTRRDDESRTIELVPYGGAWPTRLAGLDMEPAVRPVPGTGAAGARPARRPAGDRPTAAPGAPPRRS